MQDRVREVALDSGVKPGSYLDDLCPHMSVLILSSKSDNTNKNYFNAFKRWETFIKSHGHSALPANPIHVALYLTHLLENGATQHPINSAEYGIKWAHDCLGFTDPTKKSFVLSIQEAARRKVSKSVNKKEPITKEVLIELCVKFQDSTDLLIVRNLTMMLFSFAGFLQFDELSSLCFNDVLIRYDYLVICIKKSKTDQYRQGNEVLISKGDTPACPVSMYQRYLELVGDVDDEHFFVFRPIFRSKDNCKLIYKNKKMSYSAARNNIIPLIKSVVGEVDIGHHSLRSGGATVAANSDVDNRCLKRHGRWKTDSSKDGYIVDSVEKRLLVSKSLGL